MSDDTLTAQVSGLPQTPEQVQAIVDELRKNRQFGEYAQLTGDRALAPFGTSLLSDSQEDARQLGAQAQKNVSEKLQSSQFDNLMKHQDTQSNYQDRDLAQRLSIAQMEDQTRRDIASNKLGAVGLGPADQSMIDSIGSYKQPLPSSRSPRNLAIIDAVTSQYPQYDANIYTQRKKAESDFGTGAKGDMLRQADVAIQHLDTADNLAAQLHNTNYPLVNSGINFFKNMTGSPDIKAFSTAKNLVSDEVNKFVLGSGAGSLADRKSLQDQIDSANSPAALKAVTDTLRTLMGGQMTGLKGQYEASTGLDNFESRLHPRTLEALGMAPAPKPDAPTSALSGALGASQPDGSLYNKQGMSDALQGKITGPLPSVLPGAVQAAQGPPASPVAAPPQAPQGAGSPAAQPPIPVRSMPQPVPGVTIVRTGKRNGKRVAQLSNGQVVDLD